MDRARLHIKVDTDENANYDIALESETVNEPTTAQEPSSFTLHLQEYVFADAEIIYDDFATGLHLVISEMNHLGNGDLSLENSKLQTKTDALVSFEMDSTQYLSKNKVTLEALIGIDLQQNKYSFLENTALVNQLPLVFNGFVQINEDNQNVDISFKTPSSDFKNFLAVIPEAYATNLAGVATTGNFEVNGWCKGIVDDDHIPTLKIGINAENASFKYADLPKSVRNIFIDAKINNKTGIAEDTYLNINRLRFKIDEDQFDLTAKINELLGNTTVELSADGKINLANLAQAYPMTDDYGLTGILSMAITSAFDMASLENHQYQNTKTVGKASISGFHYQSDELKHPVDISEAKITFNPTTVSLDTFEGAMGQTDFSAKGTLTNALGYIFNDEDLEGRFSLKSNIFSVNDFMVGENKASEQLDDPQQTTERIRVPGFLNAVIDASANTVLYDNLALKNVKGQLLVKDETAKLQQLTSEVFGGKLALDGMVNTKGGTSIFDMDLGIDGFKIAESFKALEFFKVLAPVAQAFQGKLNADIKISGNLNDDMTPNLTTLSGDLLGQLLSARVTTQNAPALAALDDQFDFIDLNALNWNDLNTALSFTDGKVVTKPMSLNYKDIGIALSGSHTFDAQLRYQATLDVPAKYLGSDVNDLIAKIDDSSLQDLTIPVVANISGGYMNPKVTTDLTSGISKLTQQLIEIQKQKLLDRGKEKATGLIGGLLGAEASDTTQNSQQGVKQVLGGLLGGQKQDSIQSDTASQKNGVKNAAKTILGGLLGKKKDTTKGN